MSLPDFERFSSQEWRRGIGADPCYQYIVVSSRDDGKSTMLMGIIDAGGNVIADVREEVRPTRTEALYCGKELANETLARAACLHGMTDTLKLLVQTGFDAQTLVADCFCAGQDDAGLFVEAFDASLRAQHEMHEVAGLIAPPPSELSQRIQPR